METNEKKLAELENSIDSIRTEYDDLDGQFMFIRKEMDSYSFDYEFKAAKKALESLYGKASDLHKRLCEVIYESKHYYDDEKELDGLDVKLKPIILEDPEIALKCDKLETLIRDFIEDIFEIICEVITDIKC